MLVRKILFFSSLFLIGAMGLFGQDGKSSMISPPIDNIFDFYLSESDKVYFGNSENLWIYDLIQDTLINHSILNLSSEITAIIAHEERNEVFLGTKDGNIGRFDYQNKNMTHFASHPGDRITSLAFDAEQKFLIAGGTSGMVFKHGVADIAFFEVLHSCSKQVTDIELSSVGNFLVVSDGSGTISLFDATKLSLISSALVSDNFFRDLSFEPGSDRFVAVDDKGIFTKWRISQSKYLVNISESRESSSSLLCVDVSSEGLSFCFGGINQNLYVQTPYGNYKKRFQGPVLKSSFFEKEGYLFFVNCLYGKGIFLTSLAGM